MDQERNFKFMQIAMKYLPEAQTVLKEKGMEVNLDLMQPMLDMLLKVMNDAYELGTADANQNK
ncbi:ComZ family protein [Schinkia sp. CFF1]